MSIYGSGLVAAALVTEVRLMKLGHGVPQVPGDYEIQRLNSLVERGFLTTDLPQNGPNRGQNQVILSL